MNREALVTKIAERTGASKAETHRFVDAFIAETTTSLKKGQDVKLIGFGTLRTIKRKARVGRNPQTGAAIKIPATKSVRFKAGVSLRQMLN